MALLRHALTRRAGLLSKPKRAERKYCRPQARPFRLGFPRKVPVFPICPPPALVRGGSGRLLCVEVGLNATAEEPEAQSYVADRGGLRSSRADTRTPVPPWPHASMIHPH